MLSVKKLWISSFTSVLTYFLGAQKNHLIERVVLSTHNTNFGCERRKSVFDYVLLQRGLLFIGAGKTLIRQSDQIVTKCKGHLGDNCIQIFLLGRYIVGYMVLNLVLRRHNFMIFERISNDIPPQMKLLNMVIIILMHFCSSVWNWSVASPTKPHNIQWYVT